MKIYFLKCLVFSFLLSFTLFGYSNAALLTFDDLVGGVTSYNYDGDGDGTADVIFSTSDPSGFNTMGPGFNMSYINEPGIEGTDRLSEDLRVDFVYGASGSLGFGFAQSLVASNQGCVNFRVYDDRNNILTNETINSQFSTTSYGISSFPENQLNTDFSGTASYATFNFLNGTGYDGRYIIDDFTGTFGSSEEVYVREDIPENGESHYVPNRIIDQSSSLDFSLLDQSMWAEGDAFIIDYHEEFGPSYSGSITAENEFGFIDISASYDFNAQLVIDASMNSGSVDINLPVDVDTQMTLLDDGRLAIDSSYTAQPETLLTSFAPEASLDVYFDYGFGASIDEIALGPFDFLDDPVVLAEYRDTKSIINLDSNNLYGNASETLLEGDYGSLAINQPNGPLEPTAGATASDGSITARDMTNPLIEGVLDADAIAIDLAKLSGVTIPDEALEYDFHYDENTPYAGILFDADEYVSAGYTTFDAELTSDISLFQEFDFTPYLEVTYASNTGETETVKVGETAYFNNSSEQQQITATYSLDQSALTNTLGVNADFDAELTLGQFYVDYVHSLLPNDEGHYDFSMYHDNFDFGELDLGIYNQTFELDGFSEYAQVFDLVNYAASGTQSLNDILSDDQLSDLYAGHLNHSESFSELGGWEVDGTAYLLNGNLVLETHSPTYVFSEYYIPSASNYLSFDFMSDVNVDDDQLVLMFNDDILFSLFGDNFGYGWMRSEFIDISRYAGQEGIFTFALLSPEGQNSSLFIDNLNFYTSDGTEPVPEPSTILLLGSGLLGLAWYGWKRKTA